jgi:PilZ domain
MFINREDYRKHQRVLCSSLLEIVLPKGDDPQPDIVGVVEDVSERGLCVSVDVAMRPGSAVQLRGMGHAIAATIRHCDSDEAGGYHVGLEFPQGYEWAADGEWPEHRT